MSAASAISWAMTRFSLARSPAASVGRKTRSATTAMASCKPARERSHLEAGALVAGGGVDVTARGLDHLDDVARRALAGALEHHVLEQVRPARLRLRLVQRAAADDDGERQGLQARHRIADDAGSVRQHMNVGRSDRLRPLRSRGRRPSPPRRRPAGDRPARPFSASALTARGVGGAAPAAFSTASGNLAGWAVASTTIGVVRRFGPTRRRRRRATAVCGSISSPLAW